MTTKATKQDRLDTQPRGLSISREWWTAPSGREFTVTTRYHGKTTVTTDASFATFQSYEAAIKYIHRR